MIYHSTRNKELRAEKKQVKEKAIAEYEGEKFVEPDVFDFDGVIDTSFTLNFLYLFGVKLGHTFFFGTTGVGGIPYIAFTSSLK